MFSNIHGDNSSRDFKEAFAADVSAKFESIVHQKNLFLRTDH